MRLIRYVLYFLIVVVFSVSGYFLADQLEVWKSCPWCNWVGAAIGLGFAILTLLIEKIIRKVPLKVILGGTLGLLLGLSIAKLLGYTLSGMENNAVRIPIFVILSVMFGYIGMVLGSIKVEEFNMPTFGLWPRGAKRGTPFKVVDTSVIIDGRILDICESGFIEGVLIIPQFVLQELQLIADSSDPVKRARGRRGLEILRKMQRREDVEIKIVDQDFPNLHGVDSKLIALALDMQAKIITNDYNLAKVAELQGIQVLNINKLASALKPVVLPGEVLHLQIMKEGKEEGQGVAYLEDGTMVVVENASKYLGKEVDVSVTSVLQTTAGRMIFTTLKEEGQRKSH